MLIALSVPMRVITLALVVALGASVACRSTGGGETPPVLFYTGAGTSPGDVVAVRRILDDSGLAYATATSAQLDAMDTARLRAHRLLDASRAGTSSRSATA